MLCGLSMLPHLHPGCVMLGVYGGTYSNKKSVLKVTRRAVAYHIPSCLAKPATAATSRMLEKGDVHSVLPRVACETCFQPARIAASSHLSNCHRWYNKCVGPFECKDHVCQAFGTRSRAEDHNHVLLHICIPGSRDRGGTGRLHTYAEERI
jgi:hypothetical protein